MMIASIFLLIVFSVSWIQFNAILAAYDTRLNIDNLTPADYSVMLKNLPIDKMSEDEISKTFEADMARELSCEVTDPIKIYSIVYGYDLSIFKEKSDELSKLRKERAILKNKDENSPTLNQISQEINNLEVELDDITKPGNLKKLNIAIATFTYTISDNILPRHQSSIMKTICNSSSYKMKNHAVNILPAPEPEDVKWENLN